MSAKVRRTKLSWGEKRKKERNKDQRESYSLSPCYNASTSFIEVVSTLTMHMHVHRGVILGWNTRYYYMADHSNDVL